MVQTAFPLSEAALDRTHAIYGNGTLQARSLHVGQASVSGSRHAGGHVLICADRFPEDRAVRMSRIGGCPNKRLYSRVN